MAKHLKNTATATNNMYGLLAAGKPFEVVVECSLLPQIRDLALSCRELKLTLLGDGSGYLHRDAGRPNALAWVYRNVHLNTQFRNALVERAQGYPVSLCEALFHCILHQHFGGHDVDFDRVFAEKKRAFDQLIDGVSHQRGRRLLPLCDLRRTNTRGGFGHTTGLAARDRREFTEVNVTVGDNTLRMYEGPQPREIVLFGLRPRTTFTWDGTNNELGACYGPQGFRAIRNSRQHYRWQERNHFLPPLPFDGSMRVVVPVGPDTVVNNVHYSFTAVMMVGGQVNETPDTTPFGAPTRIVERTSKRVYTWTPGTDEWERLADLLQGRTSHAVVDAWPFIFVLGGRTVFAGDSGIGRVRMTHTVECLDMNRGGQWRFSVGLPRPMAHFAALCMDGHLVVMGGMTETTSGMFPRGLNSVLRRDVADAYYAHNSSWRACCPLLMPTHAMAAVKVTESKVVIAGGYSIAAGITEGGRRGRQPLGTSLGLVYEYSFDAGKVRPRWCGHHYSTMTSSCLECARERPYLGVITELAFRRAFISAGVIRGKLHIFGGNHGVGHNVEIATAGEGVRFVPRMQYPEAATHADVIEVLQMH